LILVADENFNHDILRGLVRKGYEIDILTARDAGILGRDDIDILRWAATQNYVVLTHDVNTMTDFANQLLRDGEEMAGVIVVPELLPIRTAINDLAILVLCSAENEINGLIRYLPL
jgi:predicted nuclease of predicted toxin-antitoxin system